MYNWSSKFYWLNKFHCTRNLKERQLGEFMSDDIHKGHRKRVKERFLKQGLRDFPPHNALELLLFYAIPRRDTNEIAHNLIKKFGTISAVFDASVEELVKVKGVSDNTAVLIKMIPAFSSYYMADRVNYIDSLNSTEKIGAYFLPKFIGQKNECVYILCLDSKFKILKSELLFEGSVNAVSITNRKVIEVAALVGATSVVIAHNHPNGIAIPSDADIATTIQLKKALALINTELIDHIIVADDDFVSLADSGVFMNF